MLLSPLLRPWKGRLTESRLEPLLRLIPSILYMALIYSISALPASDIPAVIDDRIAHFVEYGVFGIVLTFTAAGLTLRPPTARHYVTASVFGVLFALTDEWHQAYVPGRESSLKDIAFDALGLGVALGLVLLLVRRPGGRP